MTGAWLLYDDVPTGHHPGYVDRIVGAMQEHGLRPIVATPSRPSSLRPEFGWIPVVTRPLRAVSHNFRQLRRVILTAREMGADTLIDLYLDKNIWPSPAARGFPRRVHVLHHAEQYDLDRRTGLAGMRTRVLRRRLRQMTASGARVAVHTSRAAEIMSGAVEPRSLAVIGYPVPTPKVRHPSPAPEVPVLLFVGGARYEKGLDCLVRALPLMTQKARLRVVGSQPGGTLQKLDPERSPVLEWLDRRVSDEELWSEYDRASLAVLPYRMSFGQHGGPSSVLLEAIGAGLPVVTTPALAEQLPPEPSAYIVARSEAPTDLARAIDSAIGRIETLTRSSMESGPQFVRQHHSYTAYVEALAALVESTD